MYLIFLSEYSRNKKVNGDYSSMVSTVAQLAANAKMNLQHEDCWQTFNAVIKPQNEQLISSYFIDWQKIEEDVTAIVMKHKVCLPLG
jgi:hypothetical protein